MRTFFTALPFVLIGWLSLASVQAGEPLQAENSEPYLSIVASQKEVRPKDEFSYTITFGNRGPRMAENVRITLNTALGGRAPLTYVTADPQPSNWLSSEFGSLPEYFIPELESFEATGEGKLTMTVAVRESAIAQTITSTASLEAPKRESGKRLIVSEPISVVIVKTTGKNEGGLENGGGEATEATKASIENANRENEMKPSPVQPTTSPPKRGLLQSESLWTSIAFLGAATLLLFGFVTGRLSKRDKKKLQ